MTRAKDISKIITDADLSGTLDVTGEVNLSANLNLGDNDKAIFGAGSDLQIYHDSSNSIIKDTGTGRLQLLSNRLDINKSDGSEGMATFIEDAQVILYYDNAVKFQTTSTGVDVTGAIEADDKITIAYEAGSSDWELESTSGDDFTISRNGSEKLLIDGSTSNVGIGTSSPTTGKLVINSTQTGTEKQLVLRDSTNGWTRKIGVDTSNNLGFFDGDTERMRINSSGNVGIGDSSNIARLMVESNFTSYTGVNVKNNNSSPSGAFINFTNYAGTQAGSISHNGSTSVGYNTSSDHRLKENVVAMTDATTRLKQLQPKRFNFIADTDDTTVDGFLAHEVQSVVPEAITGTHNEVDDDGNPVYQGIDQSKLVPLLVKTIQELEARITALETA